MEEDIKNMSKEELLEYLEDISQQLDNIALDQIQFAISELQFFKEEYKKLEEDNNELRKYYASKKEVEDLKETIACLHESSKEMFIPTSVIQEKIMKLNLEIEKLQIEYEEEVVNAYKQVNLGKQTMLSEKIELLQELLEERNK